MPSKRRPLESDERRVGGSGTAHPSNSSAANCQRCGHTRTAHKSVLPPKGACYMPGCVCNSYAMRIAAINEGLSADDKRAINEGIERRLHGGFPGLGCVSPAEGTPQVGTEEGCG